MRKEFKCEICGKLFRIKSGHIPRFCSIKCRTQSRKTGQNNTCPSCGKIYWVRPYQLKMGWGSTCSKKCRRIENRKKIKLQLNNSGYYRAFDEIRGKYGLYHRVLYEKHIGRPLESYEIIHHKDGNKTNNDIENLELTVQSIHGKETRKCSINTVRCPHCLKDFRTEGL